MRSLYLPWVCKSPKKPKARKSLTVATLYRFSSAIAKDHQPQCDCTVCRKSLAAIRYCAGSGSLAGDGFYWDGKFTYDELVNFGLRAGVINIDSNQVSVSVVVEHDALGNLAAFHAGLFRQIDI